MENVRILLVDDEENVLKSIKRLLRSEAFEVDTETSPRTALEKVRSTEYAVVISDQRMPEMNGVEFLSKVKTLSHGAIRILLTGYADVNAAMGAINKGEVYRFLTKPWNDEDLRLTIRHAVEHAQLKVGFVSSVCLLAQVGEMHSSIIGRHSKRVAALAKQIAERMNLPRNDIFQVEMAALLHDIGKIGIPSSILEKRDEALSDTERSVLERHPIQGESIVARVPNLRLASTFTRHHHEHFDGSGYPDRLKGDKISIGSRIIALVDAFDRALNTRHVFRNATPAQALQYVVELTPKWFDPEVASVLKKCVTEEAQGSADEIEIRPSDLNEGMNLSRDLKTSAGVLILPRESEIDKDNFNRVKKYIESNPFIEGLYVYRKMSSKIQGSDS